MIGIEVSVIDRGVFIFTSAGKDQRSNSTGLAERSRGHCAFKGQEGGPNVKGHAVFEWTVRQGVAIRTEFRVPLSGNPHRSRSLVYRAYSLWHSHWGKINTSCPWALLCISFSTELRSALSTSDSIFKTEQVANLKICKCGFLCMMFCLNLFILFYKVVRFSIKEGNQLWTDWHCTSCVIKIWIQICFSFCVVFITDSSFIDGILYF